MVQFTFLPILFYQRKRQPAWCGWCMHTYTFLFFNSFAPLSISSMQIGHCSGVGYSGRIITVSAESSARHTELGSSSVVRLRVEWRDIFYGKVIIESIPYSFFFFISMNG